MEDCTTARRRHDGIHSFASVEAALISLISETPA
jgi:hypothetical protein